MHKGYTINYFINFFKNIPDHQWCTGADQEGTRHCAYGHALRDARVPLDESSRQNYERVNALEGFLANRPSNAFFTTCINDNEHGRYTKLGSTPRGRILKALRNRKRTGNIFGRVTGDK